MRDAQRLTGFRKVASAIWGAPTDPQIYGLLEVDAGPLLAFIDQARAAGVHLTPTHLVGRAVAKALEAVPALNVRLVGGKAVTRGSIDVFFITAMNAGNDLSGVKIDGIDRKSAASVARELSTRSQQLRGGHDRAFALAKRAFDRAPLWLLRPALRAVVWAVSDRAWDIPALGLSKTPFGSAMVSSVGMFGLPMGFSPLVWMYRVPVLILVGEIQDQPMAIDGRCEVRPVLPLCATLDHRYVDGAHIAKAVAALRSYLGAPQRFEEGLESGAGASIDRAGA